MEIYLEIKRLTKNRRFIYYGLHLYFKDKRVSIWYYRLRSYNKRIFYKKPLLGFLLNTEITCGGIISNIERKGIKLKEYSNNDIKKILEKIKGKSEVKKKFFKSLYT